MKVKEFSELSPVFQAANSNTLKWLAEQAVEHEYPANRSVLMEDSWGNAVYFIATGWVKVRRLVEDDSFTIAVLSQGDFFGEMAVLDESPRSTDVVSLAPVRLISITAGQFIQAMLTDPQLQYTILKVMVQRLKLMNQRSQVRSHSPAKRLTNMLLELGNRYGSTEGEVTELFDVPRKDLANITDLSLEDTVQLMSRLSAKKLISVDPERQTLQLLNTKQLRLIAER